jgi:hypothetical protein
MDAEACQWLGAAIEEHSLRTAPGGDEASQRRGRGGPQGTVSWNASPIIRPTRIHEPYPGT